MVIINYALDSPLRASTSHLLKRNYTFFHRLFPRNGEILRISLSSLLTFSNDPDFRSPHSFNQMRTISNDFKWYDATTVAAISCLHVMAIKVRRDIAVYLCTLITEVRNCDRYNDIKALSPVSGIIARSFWTHRALCRAELCGAFVCTIRMHHVYSRRPQSTRYAAAFLSLCVCVCLA